MHKLASYSLLLTLVRSVIAFEQEPYPVHIAKGDNTKCFAVWTDYRTLPNHLVRAQKNPEAYANAFKFYRWTKDEETNKEKVTTFKILQHLKPEERKQITEGLYRIQKVNENKFNIYLTSHVDTVAAYFSNKFKNYVAQAEINVKNLSIDNENKK